MKDEILSTAQRLMKQGGYEALNFGVIAEQLGITRANVHYHFGNKDSLAEAATAAYVGDWHRRLEQLAAQCEGDFVRFMAGLDDELARELETSEGACSSICSQLLKNRASLPPALGEMVDRHHAHVLDFLEQLITSARRRGQRLAPELTARHLAREAMAVFFGALSLATALHDTGRKSSAAKGVIRTWAERLGDARG
jgi:AcrR family transcriptional regulator